MPRSYAVLSMLLFLAMVAAQNYTVGNVTFAPPPAITSQLLYNFTNSSADATLIWSKKLEILNLASFPLGNGSTITNVTLTAFNRSVNGSRSIYEQSLFGDWVHVESSPQSLSCNLIMEKTTKVLALLSFNRIVGVFKLQGMLPLAAFTNDTNTNITSIRSAMAVGQMCRIMTYSNPFLGIFTAYRASANFSTIHLVLLPFATVQAISDDLLYAIGNNQLYAYDINNFQYVLKKSFNSHQKYMIKNQGGRIIVWAYNTNIVANNTGMLDLSTMIHVYVFHNTATAFVEIGVLSETHLEFNMNSAVSQFMLNASPQMTKFGFGITISNNSMNGSKIVAQHVDFNANKMYPLQFTDPAHYATTVRQINVATQLDFNDFYLVVRNASYAPIWNGGNLNLTLNNTPPVEEVWQIIGQNFTFLRSRYLADDNNTYGGSTVTREFTSFVKTFIDNSITDVCVVIDIYQADNTTYDLVEWRYGSIMANRMIIKPTSPSYIDYVEPAPVYNYGSTSDIHQWAYFQISSVNASNTMLTVVSVDNTTTTHVRFNNYTLIGSNWTMVFQNAKCKILRETVLMTTSVFMEANGTYFQLSKLDAVIGNLTITNNSFWQFSDDCTRGRVDSTYIHLSGPTNWTRFDLLSSNVTITNADSNITYALDDNSSIWRFNPSNSTIMKVFTPPNPFPIGSMITSAMDTTSSMDKVAVYMTNSSSAWFVGLTYTYMTGQFQKCLNYSFHDFVSTPKIEASPLLNNVMIYGQANAPNYTNQTTIPKADMYFINCPSYKNISFPTEHLKVVGDVRIKVGEEFVHLLKLDNVTNKPIFEIVYYLSKNTVTVMAFEKTITLPTTVQYIRSQVWRNSAGVNFLLNEYMRSNANGSSDRIVNVTEVNGKQAVFNSENNGSFTAEIVDGQFKICAPGCSDCICSACIASKYVMDATTQKCKACAPGCQTCDATDQTICITCLEGTFLNSTFNCESCDPACEQCSGTATSCSTCPSGQFFFSGNCQLCPNNCFECSSLTVCTTCNKGFAVTGSGYCRGCSSSCSDCNPYNITECTACSKGLYILNNLCSSCPSNCLECSSATSCALCSPGYTANTNGVCVVECQLPCITCADNQPNFCLSCPLGSNLAAGICTANFTCNATQSCSDCGYGLNYFLVPSTLGAVCTQCGIQTGCIQCDETNTQKCSICLNGYYKDTTGSCVQCNSNCTTCDSANICSKCTPGWTLKDGQTEGRCRACVSPCATCSGLPNYCLSCITGFTKQGWHCRNNSFIGFTLVVTTTPDLILADIDLVICKILAMLQGLTTSSVTADCDQSLVTFNSIATGSTIVSGTSSTGTSSNLQSGLSSGSIGYPVTGSTVTSYGGESSSSESSSKVGLIVGLVVGLIALVVIVVVIVYCLKKNRASQVAQSEHADDNVMIEVVGEKKGQNSGFEALNMPVSNVSNDNIEEKFN